MSVKTNMIEVKKYLLSLQSTNTNLQNATLTKKSKVTLTVITRNVDKMIDCIDEILAI